MIEVTQYIASDGAVFTDKAMCLRHEMKLKGEICTVCDGAKGSKVENGHGPWGETEYKFVTCQFCKGTGIKDKNWAKRKSIIDDINRLYTELRKL